MALILGVFIIGTFFGLATGRLFCKQHHKDDADNCYKTGRCSPGCCGDDQN